MESTANRAARGLLLKVRVERVVNMPWMLRAARLPGRTASIAVALWAGVSASGRPEITLTPGLLRQIGVSRESGYAAVDRLIEAGLISADRQRGRPVKLVLLDENGEPLRVPNG